MTFALVAYLLMNGQIYAYVLDSGLTAHECNTALAEGALSTMDHDGYTVNLADAPLVCELELDQ